MFESIRHRIAFALGSRLLSHARWAAAARAFRRATGLAPSDARSHESLGIALLKLDAWEAAAAAFQQAIRLDPDLAEAQVNRGAALARLERWDEASHAYRRALELEPDDVASHENLGLVLSKLGRWDEAAGEFEKAIELGPDTAERRLYLGIARMRLQRWRESAAALRRATELDPGLEAASENLALVRAQLVHEPAPLLCPDLDLGSRLQGPEFFPAIQVEERGAEVLGLGARGHEEEALARQRLVASNPTSWQAHVDLAAALIRLERWSEAAVACRKALALHPDLAQHNPQVPAILARAELWEEAAAVFRRQAAFDPGAVEAHANLGVALVHLERWDEAADAFAAAVAAAPERPQLHEALCAVLANAGRWEDAAAASRSWIAVDPDRPEAQRQLATALENLERVEEAVAAHRRIVEAAPDDPLARLQVGIGLSRLERWQEAVSQLEAGAALAPRDASFPFLLVEPLLRLGRGSEAVAAHRSAVELGGELRSVPGRTASPRVAETQGASAQLGPALLRVERWLARLAGTPARSSSDASPRLLFVLDEDYGELTLLMYLTLGQELFHQTTLLLPDRLHALHADVFPGRTHRYDSLDDILRVVEEEAPDAAFFCSGYLLPIHGLLTLEELASLVTDLRKRGCRVVTTDPFLGMLSERDPRELVSIHIPESSSPELQHVKEVEDQRLWSHLSRSEEIFAHSHHLYPACDRLPEGSPAADARNLSSFNPALLCPELAADASGPAHVTPHWLFTLSQTDYETQTMFESPKRFADIVAGKFVEAVAQGRHPILVGPNDFLDLLAPRLPTTRGIDLLSYCPFNRMISLLLSAEYAFYWNVVSHSILIRLYNRLPVVLFDRGHLVRNVTAMYDRVVQWYYRGIEPTYFDHREPLSLEALAAWAEAQQEEAGRILSGFRAAPTPDELVADLLKRTDLAETGR